MSQDTITTPHRLPPARMATAIVRKTPVELAVVGAYLESIIDRLDQIEPGTLDWIDGFHSEATFYDVGASFGLYTLYAALTRGAEVLAFEPEAQNFALLEMNHHLNRARIPHPVRSFNLALSDESRLGQIFIRRYEAGLAMKILDRPVRRLETERFEPAHVQSVIEEPLDALIERYRLPFPHHIKIDVDGPEDRILKGAFHTLRDPRLRSVLVEVEDPDGAGHTITEMLEEAGLACTSIEQVEDHDSLINAVFTRR